MRERDERREEGQEKEGKGSSDWEKEREPAQEGRRETGGRRAKKERSRKRKPKGVKGRGGPLQVAPGTWV